MINTCNTDCHSMTASPDFLLNFCYDYYGCEALFLVYKHIYLRGRKKKKNSYLPSWEISLQIIAFGKKIPCQAVFFFLFVFVFFFTFHYQFN